MTYILVVEDDLQIQQFVQRKLENAGFRVRSAHAGPEAMSIAMESRPMLALIDILLPGLSGLEICKAIKQQYGAEAPPVIILTALGNEADVQAGDHAGADDYIIKPFFLSDMLKTVQTHLRGQGRQSYSM